MPAVGVTEKQTAMVVPVLLFVMLKQVCPAIQFVLTQEPTMPIPVILEFCIATDVVATVPVVVTLVIFGLFPVPFAASSL